MVALEWNSMKSFPHGTKKSSHKKKQYFPSDYLWVHQRETLTSECDQLWGRCLDPSSPPHQLACPFFQIPSCVVDSHPDQSPGLGAHRHAQWAASNQDFPRETLLQERRHAGQDAPLQPALGTARWGLGCKYRFVGVWNILWSDPCPWKVSRYMSGVVCWRVSTATCGPVLTSYKYTDILKSVLSNPSCRLKTWEQWEESESVTTPSVRPGELHTTALTCHNEKRWKEVNGFSLKKKR